MTNDTLAKRLKEYRKKTGLTQEQLSNALCMKRSAYAYYETGKTMPKLETLVKLASIYNVTLDDLVCEKKELVAQDAVTEELKNSDFNDTFYDLSDVERAIILNLRVMSREKRAKIFDQIFDK